MQVRTGQYIVEHGWPAHDPFSFTAGENPYPEHEWLSCVLFWLIYAVAGVTGVNVMKGVVGTLSYLVVIHTARHLGARWTVILPCVAVLLLASAASFVGRPHIFSSFLLAIYSYVLVRFRRGHLRARWLWIIPPLHALWVNMGYVWNTCKIGHNGLMNSSGRAASAATARVECPYPGHTAQSA